jgi:hypothetical protein
VPLLVGEGARLRGIVLKNHFSDHRHGVPGLAAGAGLEVSGSAGTGRSGINPRRSSIW